MQRRFLTALFVGLIFSAIQFAKAEEPKPTDTKATDTKAAEPKADKDGFYSLFDGKSLDGWKIGKNPESWKVEDGMLVVHGVGPAHLFYEGPVKNHDFKNFHMKVTLMTYPKANSGIYFHTKFQDQGWPDQGFESQVNATHGDWKKSGGLYDISDVKEPGHVDEKWFLYEIIVKGKHVETKIDGKTMVDWTQPEDFVPAKNHLNRVIQHGTFALQGHDPGSKVVYKEILVKPLDD